MRRKKSKKSFFDILNLVLMFIFCITILYPFINTISKSLSSDIYITTGQVYLLPKGFTTAAYKYVMSGSAYLYALRNTVLVTVIGTTISLIVIIMAGYAFSRKFRFHKFLFIFLLITMFFSGGMIPTYLIVKSLKLTDNLFALILPSAFSMYNMILAKNFFNSLPREVFESGTIDGCNELQLFTKVALPMAKPIVATLVLFIMVGKWNTFTDAILYLNKASLYPLQVYIRNIVFGAELSLDAEALSQANEQQALQGIEAIKSTVLMASTIPIMCVYPFLQKYFVKGIHMGAVKG